MSQDSHSLHLQFTQSTPLQLFQRWLASYRESDVEAQQRWGRMLGLQGDELGADALDSMVATRVLAKSLSL